MKRLVLTKCAICDFEEWIDFTEPPIFGWPTAEHYLVVCSSCYRAGRIYDSEINDWMKLYAELCNS